MSVAQPSPGVTPPDLDDPHQFVRRPAVPIMDTHTRKGREVDADLLQLICQNSNKAVDQGEFPLLLIGHTDDDGPEKEQPPLAGFVKNFQMGEWRDRPCILADLYYDRNKAAESFQYPRRSPEVFYSDNPEWNVIDSVALLKRTPERRLGLVTYSKVRERYAMEDQPDIEGLDLPEVLTEPIPLSAIPEPGMPLEESDIDRIADAVMVRYAAKMEKEKCEKDEEEDESETDESKAEKEKMSAAEGADYAPGMTDTDTDKEKENMAAECDKTDEKDEDETQATDKVKPEKEKERMARESAEIKLERYRKQAEASEAKVAALETKVAALEKDKRLARYERDLIQLEAEGFEFVRSEELDDVADLDQAAFDKHKARIKTRYSRSLANADPVKVVKDAPDRVEKDDALTDEDTVKLVRYCADKKYGPERYMEALDAYKADKKAGLIK